MMFNVLPRLINTDSVIWIIKNKLQFYEARQSHDIGIILEEIHKSILMLWKTIKDM